MINDNGAQFPVFQHIGESHNTIAIQNWILNWLASGAPPPKEAVSDFSRALLIAMIRAFTGILTIEQYADACLSGKLPQTYIRVDVAHVMKIYAVFMSNKSRRIKAFFMGAIGQLILSRTVKSAKTILKHLFTVCRSETCGVLPNGEETECEKSISALKALITNEEVNDIINRTLNQSEAQDNQTSEKKSAEQGNAKSQTELDREDVEKDFAFCKKAKNKWGAWGRKINDDVVKSLQEGSRDNPYYFKELADRLLREIESLPLWTCVLRDLYGYGRVPASSACVESEVGNTKNRVMQDEVRPGELLRVDSFVEKHILYLNGALKQADAKNVENTEPEQEEDEQAEKSSDINEYSAQEISLFEDTVEKGNDLEESKSYDSSEANNSFDDLMAQFEALDKREEDYSMQNIEDDTFTDSKNEEINVYKDKDDLMEETETDTSHEGSIMEVEV